MNEKPLVSIITPSFNQAKFLEQTITSVLNQDYPNLEYLVVDGGSVDGSQDIIKKHAAKLKWWVSEPDRGQADAINKGFQRARGEYVAWLNSDDYYLPDAISKVVNVFQSHPDLSLVYGNVLAVNGSGNIINHLRYQQWKLEDLMKFNIIGQPSVFIRRAYLQKSGLLNLSYQYLLDHQLWLRLALQAPMIYLPEELSAARFHSQSKSMAKAGDFGAEAYRIVQWLEITPAFKLRYEENKNKIWAGAHRFNARYLLDGNQPRQAFQAYLQCLRSDFSTGLREWYRIVFAFISMLGLGRLGRLHPRWRK